LHLITSDCDEATKLARVQVKAAPGGILADFADLPAVAPTGTDAVVPPEYAALADSAVLSIVLVGVVDPFEAERAERANAKVQQLVEMGFPKERAARVLSEVDGNMEAATTALLAAPAQVDEGVPNTAAIMEADGTFPFRDGTGASGESGAVLGGVISALISGVISALISVRLAHHGAP
jgi:hypothetical protein